MPPLVIAAAAAISLSVALLVWSLLGLRGNLRSVVTTNLQRGDLTDLREITLSRPTRERALQPLMGRMAGAVRRITPSGSLAALERKLMLAGRPTNWPLERVLATKLMLGGVGVLMVVLRVLADSSPTVVIAMIVVAFLLYFTPDIVLSARATERQREILTALPDSLDQMTICMEAGLGFEAAMARASQTNSGPLAQELTRTLQEMQVGVARRSALRGLADRNTVTDLRHFVTAVLQSEQYGVPISDVLRSQATELRVKRRQRAEEAARKLPLKLLFPLVLFIMPPLFIILAGPAALQFTESFAGFGG